MLASFCFIKNRRKTHFRLAVSKICLIFVADNSFINYFVQPIKTFQK